MGSVSNFQPHNLSFAAVALFLENVLIFSVYDHEIFNGEKCEDPGFCATCCHGESRYLHSKNKAFYLPGPNSDISEFLVRTPLSETGPRIPAP